MKEKYNSNFKQKIYEHFEQVINDKISLLENVLYDLIASTKNETKSSAGDKYETGRAMLQIEQDNVRKQLKEAREQKAEFQRIDRGFSPSAVTKGSLVKTDKGCLFLSIALGKIIVDGTTVISLSPRSPLGGRLVGMKPSETVMMNGTKYTIESIE